jgi:DNA-binding NarL/FixJ family response regulator
LFFPVRRKVERWYTSTFPERKRSFMAKKITVLLVDDHSLVRRGFRRMLEDEKDMDVVGEAGDGEAAVKLAKELRPQVVVMDCALPGMNGLQATREILEDSPDANVLMLSMHSESTWVRQAIEAGVKGYMLKNAVDLELGAAIRKVAAGETVFDPQVEQPSALKGERNAGLTQRELEVLQMIVDGKSNKEIATVLDLSANTIAVHRANIMNTLGIHKTAELVVYAIRAGLVNVP